MGESAKNYTIGIMKTPVEATDQLGFRQIVDSATDRFREALGEELNLSIQVFEFTGPHLTPTAGTYSPLDFLQLAMSEKLERQLHFVLLITEVDLGASTRSYVVALPSQLTNVGILSVKRLLPTFWGEEENSQLTTDRLVALMLHTTGHLIGLKHDDNARNVMYDFQSVTDLDQMTELTYAQRGRLRENLPQEAHEEVVQRGFWGFTLQQIVKDRRSIARAVMRANPLQLVTQLPTMITTALSVVLLLFFTAEIWDVATSVELYQLVLFSIISLVVATVALYRAFAFHRILRRDRTLNESTVVTSAATLTTLVLTLLVVYLLFFGIMYLAAVTIFPRRLLATWPTIDPATEPLDRFKLSIFLASMSVLTGSLGGRADSRDVVRRILFLDEES